MVDDFDVILSFCSEDNKWSIVVNKPYDGGIKTLAEQDFESAEVCKVAACLAVELISAFVQEVKSKAETEKELEELRRKLREEILPAMYRIKQKMDEIGAIRPIFVEGEE